MENNNQTNPPTNPTNPEEPKIDLSTPSGIYFTNSTILAALSYLGPLIVIPYLIAKDNPFVKFHIKQGLVVFLITAIMWVIFNFFRIYWLHQIIEILEFGVLILIIIGIIYSLQKKEQELPLIGKFGQQIKI